MTVLDRYTYVAQETATSYIPTYRTALVGDSERKVTIYTDEAELRKLSADGQLRCVNRHCKKPRMVYRHGSWMQPHFAHLDEECGHPGESPEHDATKRYLARVLAEYNPGAKIEVEKFVDPTRPDVLIKLPSELPREILYPWEVAIEVQCSGMSDEYMQQKLESNKANDIHTLYIFDAQSGLFLRSVNHYPGRRAVTKPEDFWNFISTWIYYFETEFDGTTTRTRVYRTSLDDMRGRKTHKVFPGWQEVTHFKLRPYICNEENPLLHYDYPLADFET